MATRCIDADPDGYFQSEDYLAHQEMLKEQEEEYVSSLITCYCPNGHNVFDSPTYTHNNPPECGSCRAVMTTNPGAFNDVQRTVGEAGMREQIETA